MYGAWIAWFIGSFGVALVLHLRLGRLRPALALLCAALAVLWLTVLGAFLGEALANGQTPFIDRQLVQRAAFAALIVWTVTVVVVRPRAGNGQHLRPRLIIR